MRQDSATFATVTFHNVCGGLNFNPQNPKTEYTAKETNLFGAGTHILGNEGSIVRYSKQFILVIVLIPLITIILLSLVWVRYPQSFMDSVIEFGAAFLGISFAFYLDRFIESRNKDKDRQNLLDSLRRELETIEKTAINKGIYPYIWDSGLSKEKLSLTQTG